jgi:phage tail protein X
MTLSVPSGTPASTITYVASRNDTLPGIASRFYAQTGYGDFAQLQSDIMAANPQVVDWVASLENVTVFIPTVSGT